MFRCPSPFAWSCLLTLAIIVPARAVMAGEVLLDVPEAVADERLGAERDRMEGVGDGFHGRVVAGFRALAAADPGRWVMLDGTGTVDDVADRVWAAVTPRLEADR